MVKLTKVKAAEEVPANLMNAANFGRSRIALLVFRGGAAGKADVPDAGFADFIEDFEEGLVGAVGIGADADGLLVGAASVGELGGFDDALKLRAELGLGVFLAGDSDGAFFGDVDDDLVCDAGFLGTFRGGGDGDLDVLFLLCDLVGYEEEGKEKEDDIDHGRQLERGGLGIDLADFHREANG